MAFNTKPLTKLSRGRRPIHPGAAFVLLGVADAMSGAPYPIAYDTWPELGQRNYENGRLNTINFAVCGHSVSVKGPPAIVYAKYRDAREAGIAANGAAVPTSTP